MIYLASYRPLAETPSGQKVATAYDIPAFVDSSCRREPDLEHEFPSITAIAREALFAPRLQVGDVVVYTTTKAEYLRLGREHWRIPAVLEVIERFETHAEGASWYRKRDLPLPSNCVVEGNDPLPIEYSASGAKTSSARALEPESAEVWDLRYQERAARRGNFIICKSLFRELHRPPLLTPALAERIFGEGGMPGTRTPPVVDPEVFERLLTICDVRLTTPRGEATPAPAEAVAAA